MKHFELNDDEYLRGRWYLSHPMTDSGEWFDPSAFTEGQAVSPPGKLRMEIYQKGVPLELTMAEQLLPIANARTTELLTRLVPDELQVFPISIDGREEPYWILNATVALECVDTHASSGIMYWRPEDGRPDRVGDISMVVELRIDPTKVGGHRFFRVKRWLHSLIVSEDIKEALEAAKIVGTRFTPV